MEAAGLLHEVEPALLRLATCGSVDDGKSTLIGRLLHDTRQIADDQMEHVRDVSARRGGGDFDLALLTDGLRAEREQGITIDVAYRSFLTDRRRFILADCPGHEQYTRNMVTGASTADASVLLVDARLGVQPQTRRHLAISALLRVPHVLVAVNKMDLVGWDEARFAEIADELRGLADGLGLPDLVCVPISALEGAGVVDPVGDLAPWHPGPSLVTRLEDLPLDGADQHGPLRLPVQWVIRPEGEHGGGRRYAGRIARGTVAVGDEVIALPSGQEAVVIGIELLGSDLDAAAAPRSVAVRLDRELDISRGDVLCRVGEAPAPARDLEATLCWMHERPLQPGARLLLKHGARTTRAIVGEIRERLELETLTAVPAPDGLALNDLGHVTLKVADPLVADPYGECRETGAFVLIDAQDHATLAAGMIVSAL
ncbi:MAG TPA: GTP-binding protein [Solirubrobacteraceae bacterium]|nr:GTP-binding protein [Solirubrobacteraceae bacterium]